MARAAPGLSAVEHLDACASGGKPPGDAQSDDARADYGNVRLRAVAIRQPGSFTRQRLLYQVITRVSAVKAELVMLRKRRLSRCATRACVLALLAFVLFGDGRAFAQTGGSVTVVVPYPPGGGIDVLARLVAEEIGRLQGPSMVIENRPGAGTEIGTRLVVRAAPDGNTLLINNAGLLLVPHFRKVDYDPLTDLTPICHVASTPTLIVVRKESPFRSLSDLLQSARARPGALNYGSAPGSMAQVGFELLTHSANIKMTFVPFGGTPPAVNALLGGHIDVAGMVDYPAALGQLQAGTLRALATGASRRLPDLPDVPTVAESGFKDYEWDVWYGFFVPARTPQSRVAELENLLMKAMQAPELRTKLAAQQLEPIATCGSNFAAYLRKLYNEYGRAIREANIKGQ
jgi:tripartite-type tricarboxylate transporter receptor subunit TctC